MCDKFAHLSEQFKVDTMVRAWFLLWVLCIGSIASISHGVFLQ